MSNDLRSYETICLTKVDMSEEQFNKMIERCKKAIEENGKGTWGSQDDWGKAKISYPIQKEERAQWTYFRYKSLPDGINEMKRGLKINEFVLRELTNKVPEDESDYSSLKANIVKEIADRDKVRDWKEGRRKGGPGRKFGGRDFRDSNREGGYSASKAASGSSNEASEKSPAPTENKTEGSES